MNRSLYARLHAAFGEVLVVNENEPIRVEDRVVGGTVKRWKAESGEQYRVNCPLCGDSRSRLYVSYAWGLDAKVGFPSSKLVVCHNEHCEANPELNNILRRKLSAYFSDTRKGIVNVPKPQKLTAATAKKKIEFPRPEWCVPLTKLGRPQEGVRMYLEDVRKFNLEELEREWGVVYAYDYPVKDLGKDYSWLAGRLFIPIIHGGNVVGWQARVSSDEVQTSQKYYNCPGWSKSNFIYNFDNARQHRTGLLVEGVTDVWRVRGGSFCTFGKSLSSVQEDMIAANWQAVGVLYDPDTDDDKYRSAAKAIQRLSIKVPKVFRVNLPDNRDPAECSFDLVWDCIERDARSVGLTVMRPSV